MAQPSRRHLRQYGHLWFVLPGLLVFAAFSIYPAISAFAFSLKLE